MWIFIYFDRVKSFSQRNAYKPFFCRLETVIRQKFYDNLNLENLVVLYECFWISFNKH